jgi:hypothetical protein
MLKISPPTATVANGKTQRFTATEGELTAPADVNWSISPATGAGSIDGRGVYTAPLAGKGTATVSATAKAKPNDMASASVTFGK